MKVNGWLVNLDVGNYGTNYLLRAAVAKYGLGANSPVEAVTLALLQITRVKN
jgi:hypothetical protein